MNEKRIKIHYLLSSKHEQYNQNKKLLHEYESLNSLLNTFDNKKSQKGHNNQSSLSPLINQVETYIDSIKFSTSLDSYVKPSKTKVKSVFDISENYENTLIYNHLAVDKKTLASLLNDDLNIPLEEYLNKVSSLQNIL